MCQVTEKDVKRHSDMQKHIAGRLYSAAACYVRAVIPEELSVLAFRSFFLDDICQPSIHLDFFRFLYYLCLRGGGYQKQRTSEKLSSVFALRLADWLFFVLFGIG